MDIRFSAEELRPLVAAVVAEVLAQREADEAKVGTKETFTEPEAADVLGFRAKQLRAIRQRGEIDHVLVSGRFIRYTRRHLLDYLDRHAVRGGAA